MARTRRHREPFAHPFHPARVRDRFTGFIQAESDRLISAIQPAGGAELRRAFAGPLAVAVVTEALGLRDVDADTVLSWYAAIVAAVSEVTAGQPVTVAGADAFGQLRAAVARAIGFTDKPSLLTEAARAPQGLSQDEVVSNAAVLMFGGIDTTEGMIVNAVRHLLGDPEALALVRDGADLLPNAIEESIRLSRLPRSSIDTPPAMSSSQVRGSSAVTWSPYRSPALTWIRLCLPTPTGSTSSASTPASTSPSRWGRTSASVRNSRGPRPRSRSVDSWTAYPGCGWTRTTRTCRGVSCSANRRPSTCAGLCSSGLRSKAVVVLGEPQYAELTTRYILRHIRIRHDGKRRASRAVAASVTSSGKMAP